MKMRYLSAIRKKKIRRVIEGFFRKYRSYLSLRNYKYHRGLRKKASTSYSDKDVISVIDLRNTLVLNDRGRYFYSLVKKLNDLGQRVVIRDKIWLSSVIRRKAYTRDLFENDLLGLITRGALEKINRKQIYFWTNDGKVNYPVKKRMKIHHSPLTDARKMWFPYPVHPDMERAVNSSVNSESDCERDRKYKVLFSGSVSKSYDSAVVKELGFITRVEILETLYESCYERTEYETLDLQAPPGAATLILPKYDQKKCESSGYIPAKFYLDVLRETDFVICSPGTGMPFSHNVIECISQGSIPILEYADEFQPALVHLENCLKFSSREELVEVIELALNMGQEELAAMRRSLREYDLEYLSFEKFMRKIDQREEEEIDVLFNL